jgi:hypothetical protein
MAIPAVYVTIEDASFALPSTNTGRSVYLAILADRGPHNKVVEVNSISQARRLFGKPNYQRTGQGHYLMEKALQYTQRVYVVRPVLLESPTESNNAAIANASIRYNGPNDSTSPVNGIKLFFTSKADIQNDSAAQRVYALDSNVEEYFSIGDLICNESDKNVASTKAKEVTAILTDTYLSKKYLLLDSPYEGTSSKNSNNNLIYTGTFTPIDSNMNHKFKFTNGQTKVICNQSAFDASLNLVDSFIVSSLQNSNKERSSTKVLTNIIKTNATKNKYTLQINSVNLDDNVIKLTSQSGEDFYIIFDIDAGGITGVTIPPGAKLVSINGFDPINDTANDIISYIIASTTTDFNTAFLTTQITQDTVEFECNIAGVVPGNNRISVLGVNASSNFNTSTVEGTNDEYSLTLTEGYKGNTTSTLEVADIFSVIPSGQNANTVIRSTTGLEFKAVKYFQAPEFISNSQYSFINNSSTVTCIDQVAFNSVNEGDWIYTGNDYSEARQVIDKISSTVNNVTTYNLILNAPYSGISSPINGESVKKYIPIEIVSQANSRYSTNFQSENNNIWTFYAVGAGKFYNKLYLVGRRNTTLEKMYVDGNGVVKFKYLFMDLSLYQENDDGTATLLEGPWSVSLVKEVPSNSSSSGEKQIVRDIYSGKEMYIETIINDKSEFIRCIESDGISSLLDEENGESLRLQVQSIFSSGKVSGTSVIGSDGFKLQRGEDGIQFNDQGRLNIDAVSGGSEESPAEIGGLLKQAYNGTLDSEDGSIELIVQTIYPRYQFDYVVCGGYPNYVQSSARQLADQRSDCMCLADTGNNSKADDDIAYRDSLGWNTFNAMLYSQFRKRFDEFTGSSKFQFTPVYHALENHLFIDDKYWIAEPVAGILKGAIQEPIELSYSPSIIKMEDLMDKEINVTISEPDGKYFLTQFTAYKQLSVLKRAHAVKFVHYVKKEIPKLLKDILQQKGTSYWTNMVNSRINGFLRKFQGDTGRFAAISSFSVASKFDEDRSEIDVVISLRPIRAIESINVRIVVS